ncbi:rootletin-like [Dendronephthya gigantea]|uniref:rootletin-like n=1 Tax=Dendronephthya gigantea TaxID=151771 RepID=UPI00106A7A3C|nr:rootletin-like [Dendronephthya gigantea]
MAERSSSLACKKFSANLFDKNKCQNCFKPKDAHTTSPTMPQRPTNIEVGVNRTKTTVKSGNLSIATQISTLPKILVQKWEKAWFMLYTSAILEWFSTEPTTPGQVPLGSINLDDCLGLTSAECDTSEQFTIGIKTLAKTHYLKAENRLEMDNWCRVLKPFVIASPGYKFNRNQTSRMMSYHDSKVSSPTNIAQERKTSVSRTVSAPWKAASTSPGSTSILTKRWSATEELLTKREAPDNTNDKTKDSVETQPDPASQPYYADLYVKPEPSAPKQNGETGSSILALETELAEAKRIAKQNQAKAEMCSKSLTDTKKQLEKANNVISIQKVNVEALSTEVETLKTRLRKSDEKVEKRLKELEFPTCNGNTPRDSIESGFIKLQSKLQENEKALIRRTRELEKANESRKKVAKHTRALLLELEGKLTENNSRITELEEQLMNKTLDLQYEKEERQRIEQEKGQLAKDLSTSALQSKQREITKRSNELLQQAKDEHKFSKNEHKNQQELEILNKKLEGKNSEIVRLQEQLAALDKKDAEFRVLESACKKAEEQVDVLRTELRMVNGGYTKEKTKCGELESRVQDALLQMKEKEQEIRKMKEKNSELKSEIERTRQECDTQVLLLQEDNETTRMKLVEVQEELDAVHTETDGRNPEFEELSHDFEELKTKAEKSEIELGKLRDVQVETVRNFNNEKNKRLKLETEFGEKILELENSQKEVEQFRKLLKEAEGRFEKECKRASELEGLCRSNKEASELQVAAQSKTLSESHVKVKKYESEMEEQKRILDEKNEEILRLNKEMKKRIKIDENILSEIVDMESRLNDRNSEMVSSDLKDDTAGDRTSVLGAVACLGKRVEVLSSSLREEKEKCRVLEQDLQAKEVPTRRCSICERRKNETTSLAQDLEDVKANHRKELERMQNSMNSEAHTLKNTAEEMKLKLTSKVILLQSDISELKSKQEQEMAQVNEQHKKEVESWRENLDNKVDELFQQHKQDAELSRENHQQKLNQLTERHEQDIEVWKEKLEALKGSSDEEIASVRAKLEGLERQLSSERESNERRIETLKQDYEARSSKPDANKEAVVTLTEFEEVQEKHTKELEKIKENHRRELEENKSDMMMVLQALKSDSYQSSSMSSESIEMNDELKKLERYVETLKKEHEQEIERLNHEHEEDLKQLRSDMVTLLRVQESYRTPEDEKADPNGNVVDLEGQLAALRRSHEKEIREKEEKHKIEVNQLKSDMLVAIQAASAVGSVSPKATTPPDERVAELETYITNLERDFEDERENLQNTIKKAESATKFGLRRNEEMSNKIYQMQREMEEIDSKYQKEVKLYKEAFDQEKNRKTTIGAVPGILAENESLKVKLQELELSMEQMQVRYDGEIKRYKEKFQQENVISVEELHLKIKSLEDSIEQMRLEHETELERYTKAVKKGKVSLSSTAKERDLERKIDDLESTVNLMRQKHREEVRKYRERLEDEMERHRKEVQESRAKLRKLEADTRQMEDFRNKITEFENKNSKLSKEASKCKEQEIELNETRSKNRELQRQIDTLKRKLDKLEAAEETSNESSVTSGRSKLPRYSSLDNIGLSSSARTKIQSGGEAGESAKNEDDVFEMNNNSGKSEIGGYKLNPTLKRPASVSAFPIQTDNGTRRAAYSEKRRDSGSTSNRPSYQPAYIKSSASSSSLK